MREKLRQVRLQPYRKGYGPTFTLITYDLGQTDSLGKHKLGYELRQHDRGTTTVLFQGSDFACSPMHAIDSDDTLAALLGFLTLRPGDTDAEYFEGYTPEQLDYCSQHAETLGAEVIARFGEG